MNNGQTKSIVLICKSDVILTGLTEVLKGSLADEIIQLHRGDEIIDYPEMTGNILVIATTEEIEKSGGFIRQILSDTGTIQFLNIYLEANSPHPNSSVNIFDSPALICYKVNEILNSFAVIQPRDTDTELTKREIEVLKLLTKGYSNKEIADQLFVSTHTVISHRKNISEKTGIKSASGMTMYAILKKIIDVSEIDTADLI
ncbi:MAG: LuxR C-terminal-related transcriptional regulator [Bacteroidota bacterium]|nr:LuxR C-terminal-related transcriptional regulator [Bacteroidota bacterium]